ncbi:MAG: aldehyde ferredoxin oxidoreductase family protein [Chloroflexi bacterium]|nr:aldehyde ferredoxin oxidoreductase family protein [Chloroflexota bacterium]
MLSGCIGKMLFVHLSSGKITVETPPESLYHDFLGGYGIGARILFSRQKGGVDPLGPENMLGFVTGILTGTPMPSGNRYVVVGKSPLTGGWGDANSGGDFGPYLKASGYDAVFFSGISPKPVYLVIKDGNAELKDAANLWGKDCYDTEDLIKAECGKEVRVACIGPSGEAMSLLSCIINNKGRAAARSGLGAVMGSKKLKAIVVSGSIPVPLADKEKVEELRKKYLPTFKTGKLVERLTTMGTFGGTISDTARKGAPTKNWGGVGIIEFPENAGGEPEKELTTFQKRRYACWHCPVGCGGHMKEGEGEYKYTEGVHKPEYETVAAFGTMCVNSNMESIIKINDICNRYGLDTISAGATVAFAIECYQNGILTKEDTGGIELKWGDHKAIVALTEKMAKREGIGALLADGSKKASEKIGKGSAQYAMHIAGQELPYHDPKNSTRFAVSYMIDATPSRHTQGGGESGKGEEQKEKNTYCQAYNSAGICFWIAACLGPQQVQALADFLTTVTGHTYTPETLLKTGERISNIRQAFNIREGINPVERKVPGRVFGNPPPTVGPAAGKTVNIDYRLQEYFRVMDWDPKTAKPSKQKLTDLGLGDVAAVLYPK